MTCATLPFLVTWYEYEREITAMLNHESLDNTSNLTKEVSQTNPLVEIFNMSSRNHAIIQMRLGAQLNQYEQYTVASELSIDVGTRERQTLLEKCQIKAERELKPDLVVYPVAEFDVIDPEEGVDPVRVTEIPLACIEIISPSQSTHEIVNKFRAYFELGVRSCWYVDSYLRQVKVYSSLKMKDTVTFEGVAEVVDPILGVSIPLNKIFGKKESRQGTKSLPG